MIEVEYRKKYLENCFKEQQKAIQKWGPQLGRMYIKRMEMVFAVNTIEDLYTIPQLKFHPLTGDRDSQHSIKLTDRARLIVECISETKIKIIDVDTTHYE